MTPKNEKKKNVLRPPLSVEKKKRTEKKTQADQVTRILYFWMDFFFAFALV